MKATGASPSPWYLIGGLAVVAMVALFLAFRGRSPATSSAAPPVDTTATPPDLSTMTPREQFSRLSDRVTAAAEQGDTATLDRFWPMVQGAYQNLPPGDRDDDAQFHMGWLRLRMGDTAGATALADSILAASRDNLFGYYLRATIAEAAGDSAGARRAHTAFSAHFDAEINRTDRPGYSEHRAMFDQFRSSGRVP